MGNWKILVTEKLARAGIEIMKSEAQVDEKLGLSPAELVHTIPQYHALVVRSATKVTREVIEAGTQLKVVGRAGIGVDNIDVGAATERGVLVANVPGGNTIAAAELTFGLMLCLARHIPRADATVRARVWDRSKFMGVELYGKTLGIIGLGRIGREVSKRAVAFGMRVLATDPYISGEVAASVGAELTSLEAVLQNADFLTIHTPLTAESKGLIGSREIAMMKPGARIINCARGGIVDEAALYEALVSGKLAGAALDVYATEPPFDSPLLELENVVLTPHLGASTAEAQDHNAVLIAQSIVRALRGEPVEDAVNPEVMKR